MNANLNDSKISSFFLLWRFEMYCFRLLFPFLLPFFVKYSVKRHQLWCWCHGIWYAEMKHANNFIILRNLFSICVLTFRTSNSSSSSSEHWILHMEKTESNQVFNLQEWAILFVLPQSGWNKVQESKKTAVYAFYFRMIEMQRYRTYRVVYQIHMYSLTIHMMKMLIWYESHVFGCQVSSFFF